MPKPRKSRPAGPALHQLPTHHQIRAAVRDQAGNRGTNECRLMLERHRRAAELMRVSGSPAHEYVRALIEADEWAAVIEMRTGVAA